MEYILKFIFFFLQKDCEFYDVYLVVINIENENDWFLKIFVERDIGFVGEEYYIICNVLKK